MFCGFESLLSLFFLPCFEHMLEFFMLVYLYTKDLQSLCRPEEGMLDSVEEELQRQL